MNTVSTTQIRLNRASPGHWRVTLDNPPLDLMGPEFVLQFRDIVGALEADAQVRVVTSESAVEDSSSIIRTP
jgi:enoyl-CoA hydratase/carnithine racemase